MTKKPTMPSSPPATRVPFGTPPVLSSRPGTAYVTTPPRTSRAATTPHTSHPAADAASVAQTTTAARISTEPGSTGTTMPTSPTSTASPTRRSVSATRSGSHTADRTPGRRTARASPGACESRGGGASALVLRCGRRGVRQLAGLVVDVHRDLAELVPVLPGVVSAEEQVTAACELDTEVGLGTAPVTAVESCQRRTRGNCSGH